MNRLNKLQPIIIDVRDRDGYQEDKPRKVDLGVSCLLLGENFNPGISSTTASRLRVTHTATSVSLREKKKNEKMQKNCKKIIAKIIAKKKRVNIRAHNL